MNLSRRLDVFQGDELTAGGLKGWLCVGDNEPGTDGRGMVRSWSLDPGLAGCGSWRSSLRCAGLIQASGVTERQFGASEVGAQEPFARPCMGRESAFLRLGSSMPHLGSSTRFLRFIRVSALIPLGFMQSDQFGGRKGAIRQVCTNRQIDKRTNGQKDKLTKVHKHNVQFTLRQGAIAMRSALSSMRDATLAVLATHRIQIRHPTSRTQT